MKHTDLIKNREGWNLYLHTFDSKDSFQIYPKFHATLDWWKYREHRKSPPQFDYDYKGLAIRISFSLISKKTLEITIVNNQKQYLTYLKQEWSPDYKPAYFIQWALRR